MNHNFSASRLRDYVKFFSKGEGVNEFGEQNSELMAFDARADVDVKSGGQLDNYGASLTESVITILTWFNPRVSSGQVAYWDGNRYEVQHIQPSRDKKSMIVTATSLGDQSFGAWVDGDNWVDTENWVD